MNSIQEGLTVFGGVKAVFLSKISAATSLGIDEDMVLRLPGAGKSKQTHG